MKKTLYFLLVYCFSLAVSAQEISVKSFRPLPNDLTARVNPVKNDNAQTCALVKIVTTERGFAFDPDGLGICGNVDESHDGEIWLWLPPGARRITIRHKDLGVLRDYEYPVAIESASTYEMVLMTGRVEVVVKQQNLNNWLVLTVNPPEAVVKIDDEMVIAKNGIVQKMYAIGSHTYEVFCDMYHPQQGTFDITADKKTVFSINLNPHFGFLKVSSLPESGATVFVNGKNVGVTPFVSGKMPSGTYTVQVVSDLYRAVTREMTISDNITEEVSVQMVPNFAEPTFICKDTEAEIWVNNEMKGIGRWHGRLPVGDYRVETRKASCQTMEKSLVLTNGNTPTVTLASPVPIYSSINIVSEPFDAEIFLDGHKMGTTPSIINNVLIGAHKLELYKEGYLSVTKTVSVEENNMLEVNEVLVAGRQITLRSNPTGAALYIDGKYIGATPYTKTFALGSYKVRAVKDNISKEEHITIDKNGKTEWIISIPQNFTCGDKMKDNDGNSYNTVKIGSQCWMAENMRATRGRDGKYIAVGKSASIAKPYRYSPSNSMYNVSVYGYLYNYSAAMQVCPDGWHLPTRGDYYSLCYYCSYRAKSLASETGWAYTSYGNTPSGNSSANNSSHFTARPAGGFYRWKYDNFGYGAYFWSSTPFGFAKAYHLDLYYDSGSARVYSYGRSYGFSVRCIKD